MTEDQGGSTDGGETPPSRRRTHRRATRPATGGDPAVQVPTQPGHDDTDAGWAPDAGAGRTTERADEPPESAQDRWWREQRPPHYE